LNGLIVGMWFGTKALTIDRFFNRRLERNHRLISESRTNSWEPIAWSTGKFTTAEAVTTWFPFFGPFTPSRITAPCHPWRRSNLEHPCSSHGDALISNILVRVLVALLIRNIVFQVFFSCTTLGATFHSKNHLSILPVHHGKFTTCFR